MEECNMKSSKYSKRQLFILIVICIVNFFSAACIAIQAPFFPAEANKKGASATEYGFVLGIFEFVILLTSSSFGKYVKAVGPKRMICFGTITSGLGYVFFGLLDYIEDHTVFISLAFLLRIVSALGTAANFAVCYAITVNEFPDNIATVLAALETFYGLGLLCGPTAGGVLYEIGGYKGPFVIFGGLYLLIMILFIILPENEKTEIKTPGNLSKIIRVPGMIICLGTIAFSSFMAKCIETILEPRLREFHLNPIVVGLIFSTCPVAYTVFAFFWAWIIGYVLRLKILSVFGGILTIIGISLIGPVKFLPLHASLTYIAFGLFMHGLGLGVRIISTFTETMQMAIAYGLPNNIETYGLVTGFWRASFALGAFIGSVFAGILFDRIGFSDTSLIAIVLLFIMVIIELISLCSSSTVKLTKYRENYMNVKKLLPDGVPVDISPNSSLLKNDSHVKKMVSYFESKKYWC